MAGENVFVKNLTDSEKAELFDQIAANYYDSNFGRLSKSQIDLLMFSIYINKLIDKNEKFDDYTMSKQLGIMQSTVRQLKKKKQLIYPREYKWYESFLNDAENAIIDGSDRIVISISDPNVYIELQHAIEEIGGYVEVQLNSKLLKIQPGFFVEVLLQIISEDCNCDEKSKEEFRDKFIAGLNEKHNKNKDLTEEINAQNFKDVLKSDILRLAEELLSDLVPYGGVVKLAGNVCYKLFKKTQNALKK